MSKLTVFFLFVISASLSAQEVVPAILPSSQVEVIKAFEATLEEANKVPIIPKLPKIDPIKKVYSYAISILPLEIKYPDPIIKPLAMQPADPFEEYNIYSKLGYGTLANPYGKLAFGGRDNLKYDYQVDISHHSLNANKILNQKMSATTANIGGKFRVKENLLLSASLKGDMQKRGNYFIFNELPNASDRKLNVFGGSLGFCNVEQTYSKINYKIKASFDHYAIIDETEKATESVALLTGNIDKELSKTFKIELPVEMRNTSYKIVNKNFKQFNFLASPQLRFYSGNLSVTAGLSFISDPYHKLSVFPVGEIAYGLTDKEVQVYAGADQQYIVNSYQHYLYELPYLNSNLDQLRSTVWNSIFGGIRGEWSFISYQGKAGFKKIKSLAYFSNIEKAESPTLNFDDGNTVFVNGNLEFLLHQNFAIGVTATKNFYKAAQAAELYGLPTMDIDAYLKISMWDDRLKIKGDLYIADRVQVLIKTSAGNNETIALNNQIELNAGAEFWISKNFGVYGQANNILDNRYARWYGYPAVGINLNGGIVLKF